MRWVWVGRATHAYHTGLWKTTSPDAMTACFYCVYWADLAYCFLNTCKTQSGKVCSDSLESFFDSLCLKVGIHCAIMGYVRWKITKHGYIFGHGSKTVVLRHCERGSNMVIVTCEILTVSEIQDDCLTMWLLLKSTSANKPIGISHEITCWSKSNEISLFTAIAVLMDYTCWRFFWRFLYWHFLYWLAL